MTEPRKNGTRFINNTDCEYFPCHKTRKPEEFNCLLCFCPLYLMDDCGGKHTFMSGIKVCSGCMVPHAKNGYDYVINKIKERNDAVRLIAQSQG